MDSKWERVYPYIEVDIAAADKMMEQIRPSERIKKISLINKGLRNSNYCVEYANYKFLLRVYGVGDNSWENEKAVYNHVKDKVNVPELLCLNSECRIIDKPYAVFEYIEGPTLDEYLQDEACNKDVISQIGQSLARIHETPYNEVGFLDKNLNVVERLPELKLWYNMFLEGNSARKLGKKLTEDVKIYVKNNSENIKRIEERIAFVHNDFRPINMIVDSNKPYLIDWEGAMAGHVFGDIGEFLRFEEQTTTKSEKLFIDNYNYYAKNRLPDDYKELVRLRDLVNLLQLLNGRYDLQNKDGDLIELIRKTCSTRCFA